MIKNKKHDHNNNDHHVISYYIHLYYLSIIIIISLPHTLPFLCYSILPAPLGYSSIEMMIVFLRELWTDDDNMIEIDRLIHDDPIQRHVEK